MKDRYFTLWFLSENDGKQKSVQVSKKFLIFTILLITLIVVFAFYGLWQVLNRNSLLQQVNELNRYKARTEIVLNELNAEKLLMEESLENSIRNFFTEENDVIPLSAPVKGIVTKGVEVDNGKILHEGLDIAANSGEKIKSPLDGFVVFSGETKKYGKIVIISHTHGLYTLYAHNEKNLVKSREFVSAEQKIATVGDDNGNGPHLHFEVWKNDEILDPREFIEVYKKRDVSIK